MSTHTKDGRGAASVVLQPFYPRCLHRNGRGGTWRHLISWLKFSVYGHLRLTQHPRTKRPPRPWPPRAGRSHGGGSLENRESQCCSFDGRRHARRVAYNRAVFAPTASGTFLPAVASARTLACFIQTMHTHGVLRPEGVKLRVVKASGRTLEDTKFHMEIRTQRPGQVKKQSLEVDGLWLSRSRLV